LNFQTNHDVIIITIPALQHLSVYSSDKFTGNLDGTAFYINYTVGTNFIYTTDRLGTDVMD